MITFKPKQVTKKLLSALPERARDVLEKRYGLGVDGEMFTLEAIGQSYGITRERVRQIENYGIASVQKSSNYAEHAELFAELQDLIMSMGGGVVAEHVLLDELAPDIITRNHLYFILVVGDAFIKGKENPLYTHRWFTERKLPRPSRKPLRTCTVRSTVTT